jgi:putative ABC transport system permease protein
VSIRLPKRTSLTTFDYVTVPLEVLALHDVPLRTEVLLDLSHADLLNLAGLGNVVDVNPKPGVSSDQIKRSLFTVSGVASVQGVTETVEIYKDLVNSMMGFLAIVEGATLFLGVLVAFNATSINADERRREHATMLAFGTPLLSVLRVMVVENLLLGLIGGGIGIGLGELLVSWLMRVSLPRTMPDVSVASAVNATSVLFAFGAAIAAVAIAPLLISRQLRALDVSSTLRVVE